MLRAVQVGLSLIDLYDLEYGEVLDIITEASNDDCDYQEVASQDDFDRF